MRARRSFKDPPVGEGHLLFPFAGRIRGQLYLRLWKVVAAQITDRVKRPAHKREREDDEKYREDEATLGETAHTPLRRRRLNPHRAHAFGLTSILRCASISLS